MVRYGLLESIEQRDLFPTIDAAVTAFQLDVAMQHGAAGLAAPQSGDPYAWFPQGTRVRPA